MCEAHPSSADWALGRRTAQEMTLNESTQSDDDSQAAWPGGIVAVTLFVEDLAAAKRFYSEVFELPVFFEDENSAVFKFGDTLINLLDAREAPELVAPAPVAKPMGASGSSSHSRWTTSTRWPPASSAEGSSRRRADGSSWGLRPPTSAIRPATSGSSRGPQTSRSVVGRTAPRRPTMGEAATRRLRSGRRLAVHHRAASPTSGRGSSPDGGRVRRPTGARAPLVAHRLVEVKLPVCIDHVANDDQVRASSSM